MNPDENIVPEIDAVVDGSGFDAFARFYDNDYRHYDDDVEVILDLASEVGDPILELGCGTGRLLTPLGLAGQTVTGVDISHALLDVAATKRDHHQLGGQVALVRADLRDFALPRRDFAFAFCVSNTLMHLTAARDQLAVLANARRHQALGGLLLIDLFNPDVAGLTEVQGIQQLADRWYDANTGATVFKWCVRSVNWADQLQETLFVYEEIFVDGRVRRTPCPFTLRFLWANELQLMLEKAGYEVETVWGDFDGEPYGDGCQRLILLARAV